MNRSAYRNRIASMRRMPSNIWRGFTFARTADWSSHSSSSSSSSPASPGCLESWYDAHTEGPGIWKWQHYLSLYDRHLAKFRGREVHVLEIGVYSGGSMQMWKDYFGDQAHIYGVDIEPVCRLFEDDRTQIFIGDQADKSFWNKVLRQVPRIDVVIDDGGHKTDQQIATLEALLPHVQPGGVFICEDLNGAGNAFHSYMDGFARALHVNNLANDPPESIADPGLIPQCNVEPNGLQRVVHSIHTYPFSVVIELHDTPVERLTAPRKGTEWKPTRTAPWCATPESYA